MLGHIYPLFFIGAVLILATWWGRSVLRLGGLCFNLLIAAPMLGFGGYSLALNHHELSQKLLQLYLFGPLWPLVLIGLIWVFLLQRTWSEFSQRRKELVVVAAILFIMLGAGSAYTTIGIAWQEVRMYRDLLGAIFFFGIAFTAVERLVRRPASPIATGEGRFSSRKTLPYHP